MRKVTNRARSDNRALAPLPLIEYGERQRWATLPLAARVIGRRFGITSAALALAICELAGIGSWEDR